MTEQTTVQINVDTFSEGDVYFVRTEILQSAQKLKAEQLAGREKVSEALKEQIQRAISDLSASVVS
jgi:hypothetical protein